MKYLILCLALLGCECPEFSFEAVVDCNHTYSVKLAGGIHPNAKGCWKIASKPGTKVAADYVCPEAAVTCTIVPAETEFFVYGGTAADYTATDVDCSEVCPDGSP